VNVHIHQFQPGGAVVDAAALKQFQEQWATYRKVVEGDFLSHREVGDILRATRPAFLDRFMRTNKPLWNVLTPAEWEQIAHHVSTCDFPETAAVWCELGREAGFRQARQVFVDPTDFFVLFRYEA
jgi:hypothetical protein